MKLLEFREKDTQDLGLLHHFFEAPGQLYGRPCGEYRDGEFSRYWVWEVPTGERAAPLLMPMKLLQ